MNKLMARIKPAVLAFAWMVAGTVPVWADDTEIYFGARESGVQNNILFVIDTSGSMGSYDGDSTTRMQELKEAFRTMLLGLDNVNVGLMRFSNPGGPVLYPVSNINEVISTSEVDTGTISKAVAAANDDGYEFNGSHVVHLTTPQLELGADAVSGLVTGSVNVQVSNVNDDSESRLADNNNNSNNGNTLDFPSTQTDGSRQQVIGIRFASVNIPVGATITSAYLQLVEREHSGTAPMVVEILGERVSGGQFGDSDGSSNSVYSRYNATTNRTTALSTWTMTSLPADDATLQTPDLSAVVQEIVNNASWASGNAMTFMVRRPSGSTATARVGFRSRDNSGTNAPRLVVNYTVGTASTGAVTTAIRFPNVTIPRLATITSAKLEFVAGASLSGAAGVDIAAQLVGDSPALTSTSSDITSRTSRTTSVPWSITDPWVSGNTYSTPDLTAMVQTIVNQAGASGWCGGNAMTFLLNGTLGRRVAEAFDNGSDVAPRLVVTYDPASVPTDGSSCKQASFVRQIGASSDDAEEDSGNVAADLSSGDLDMAASGSVIRRVGLRFINVTVPKNAPIQSAYIQFRASASSSSTVNLTIQGQAADDATTFKAVDNDISGRSKTTASVNWSPGSWTDNSNYNTENIGPIVQELVNRSGWAKGNDMAFIIEGASTSNYRSADSYNGSAGNAPKLIINYADNGASSNGYTVRDKLLEIVDSLTASGNTPLQDTFYEGVQYYRGEAVDYGKVRGGGPYSYTRVSHPNSMVPGSYTSITPAGCQDSSSSGCASETISGSAVYKSPIEYACQANHIVLLTDGLPNSDHSTSSNGQKILGLPDFGHTTSSCTYQGAGECAPELANWVNKVADMSDLATGSKNLSGKQNVVVDTIAFYQDADGNQFLEDIASKGGGKYFAASSASGLVTALEEIAGGTISENASFVAAGTGVNAFNRAFNGDDLYFSVFKPEKTPKWPGNLKKYKVEFRDDPATTTVIESNPVIVDAAGVEAVDAATGFFADTARSFWSAAVDGPNVIAGGFGSHVTDHASRNLYTNVGASTNLAAAENALVLPATNPLITQAVFGVTEADYPIADRFPKLVTWVRGEDVLNEDGDVATTTRFVVGDLLHSRPVAITYGGDEANPDTTVFVASNSGFLHAVDNDNGSEIFAFIPKDLLPLQQLLYENVESTQHPYGLDGPITPWVIDPDGDGLVLTGGAVQTDNKVYLYFGMGRGGRNYYALDVTNRAQPQLLWEIKGGVTPGFEQMGQSWAQPIKARINFNGTERRVLIIGGGYDPSQDSTTVRATDSMGAAIYIVDAVTGALIWSGGNGDATAFSDDFDDMRYGIPSSISGGDVTGDGLIDFFFVGDMGGQVWRFDVANGATTAAGLVNGGVIADLGVASGANVAANNRRFYHAPALYIGENAGAKYLGVTIGSGWQGHPLSEDTTDRYYMIRQSPIYGGPSTYTKVTEANLYDATANTIGEGSATEVAAAITALTVTNQGWYVTLGEGEKVLSSSLIVNNRVLFNTYQPSVSINANPCLPSTGTNRAYDMLVADAQPSVDWSGDGLDASDRARDLDIPGIGGDPTLVYTPEGAAVMRNQRSEDANLGASDDIKRIYWYENRER